ncbi:hypothetical protein [Curtobacterium sp. MCBD17_040]|uniref:hypothetical protein n=1 Tax=Curtobacterium sp. MCBD17_040 TaxID=2175674 RepID=UPI000DA95993|nr:hypothetical protein [Curtobacterium sp. MCBD17_040]WIB65928.1 hypothetical protein DEI94_17585 [Curtobacterium sp. MCBD17_040]
MAEPLVEYILAGHPALEHPVVTADKAHARAWFRANQRFPSVRVHRRLTVVELDVQDALLHTAAEDRTDD